jgi:hypothetical protein
MPAGILEIIGLSVERKTRCRVVSAAGFGIVLRLLYVSAANTITSPPPVWW